MPYTHFFVFCLPSKRNIPQHTGAFGLHYPFIKKNISRHLKGVKFNYVENNSHEGKNCLMMRLPEWND